MQRLLATTEGVAEVRGQTARAYDQGITSVPTFIFAGRYAVTGAQDSATLRSVLDEVVRRGGPAADGTRVPTQRTAPAVRGRLLRGLTPWAYPGLTRWADSVAAAFTPTG